MSAPETPTQSEPSALAEYAAAHDAYLHYDSFPWQVGGVFVVGVFAFWGIVITGGAIDPTLMLAGSVLITSIMAAWLLRFAHNRQLYLYHLHRIHELEARLGMSNHLRFKDETYKMDLPRGHQLNYFLFAITALGAPYLYALASGEILALVVNTVAVTVVVIWADRMGVRAKQVAKGISSH